MTFSELNIAPLLLDALNKINYRQATPIQQQAIPHIFAKSDLFGCAQTGTGKTAAFALPVMQLLQQSKGKIPGKVRALVLAPTRELASQIHENISAYNTYLGLKHAVIFGGVSQFHQVAAIRKGVDILVATPGRLMDLMNQGHINLSTIEYFVLDEADRMLDMGFIADIKKIIAKLPAKRQTLFFSATAAPDIMKLANTLLRNPATVSVTPLSSAAPAIAQSVYHVSKEDKRSLLRHILKDDKIDHALVFTRTKRGADKVAKELNSSGIISAAIHGNKSQGARTLALNGFKNRKIRVLVATDIASRGIDIEKLNYVINYEMPEQAETYVHRIGRTGRAGNTGNALSFCSGDEMQYLREIKKLTKREIQVVNAHPYSQKTNSRNK